MKTTNTAATKPVLCFAGVVALLLATTTSSLQGEDYDSMTDKAAIIDKCKANIDKELERMKQGAEAGPYKPEWDSLERHQPAPEWFRDSKFGIYFHWGIFSVPAYELMYGKKMWKGSGKKDIPYKGADSIPSTYSYHVKTYGDPAKFGYHDLVPLFKAERFDPQEWADLFVKSGAKYAGPVAEFHDGFAMWKSELTPWNAGDMGPKRDIVGELGKAIRARGMKFITTFHDDRTQSWYPRIPGMATTSSDPVLQFLYMNIPQEMFDKMWQANLGEVIDKYQPDLIWFDGQLNLIPEIYHRYFLAYYFNSAAKSAKDVMVTTKKFNYPQEVSVMDYERGGAGELTPFPWLTDEPIAGSWSYATVAYKTMSPITLIQSLIDKVSKNGQLLLDVAPKADGTIPQEQHDCLLELGKWLGVNGEAIYNTRPWLEYGEGPNRVKGTGSFAKGVINYTSQDIRYTRSKDGSTLYAIALGWPEGKLSPSIIQVDDADKGKVELIGHEGELKYTVKDKRMTIEVPEKKSGDYAYVFKLTGFKLSLTPAAVAAREQELKKYKMQRDSSKAEAASVIEKSPTNKGVEEHDSK